MNETIQTEKRTYRVADLRLVKPEKRLTDEDVQLIRDWVTELRSGNKEQGINQLHGVSLSGTEFFCCLGVLCSLVPELPKEGYRPTSVDDAPTHGYLYDSAGSYLPLSLAERLGVDTNPKVLDLKTETPLSYTSYTSLGWLNDNGATFEQIAQIIEQSWLS